MRTSIYLAVAFAILFISLSDAAVYNKRQPGNGTPNGSGFAKSISNGMKTRRNMLQRRREDCDQTGVGKTVNDASHTAEDAFREPRGGGFPGSGLTEESGLTKSDKLLEAKIIDAYQRNFGEVNRCDFPLRGTSNTFGDSRRPGGR